MANYDNRCKEALQKLDREIKQEREIPLIVKFLEESAKDYGGKIWNSRLLEDWNGRIKDFMGQSCPELSKVHKNRYAGLYTRSLGYLELTVELEFGPVWVFSRIPADFGLLGNKPSPDNFIFYRDKNTKELIYDWNIIGREVNRDYYFSAEHFIKSLNKGYGDLTCHEYYTKRVENLEEARENLAKTLETYLQLAEGLNRLASGRTREVFENLDIGKIPYRLFRETAENFLEYMAGEEGKEEKIVTKDLTKLK